MFGFILLGVVSFSLIASGQEYEERRSSRGFSLADDDVAFDKPTTPVPILKQINMRNDDGSYTFGFEAADGSFKIETKEANGEVRGKYGYTDETGKLHVVEYGANKFGFQPSGEGITVPPLYTGSEPEESGQELNQPQQRQQVQQAPRAVFKQVAERRPQAPAPVPQRAPAPAPRPAYTAPALAHRPTYTAPVPTRPQFFAGAQPVVESQPEDYDYDQPAPVQRQPAPRPAPRPQPQPQFQPKPAPQVKFTQTERPAPNFIPNPQFRQNIQLSQPEYRQAPAAPQYESAPEPPQYFRQDPVRPQPSRFTQTQAIIPEEPRTSYNPRPSKTAGTSGFFDQLTEQYSLKSGGNPVHDVSFGFY